MAVTNTTTTLTGLFKEVYGDDIENLVSSANWMQKSVKFNEATMVGNKFHQPVLLSQEHGITYAASNAGAFSLNASVAATLADAQVEGSQIVLRSRIDYESAARAANGGKKAFVNAIDLVVRNMVDSVTKRKEIGFLYGGTGIGAVNANTSASTSFVISEESWSAAIWSGMENARIDILASDLSAFATSGGNSATVLSVNMDTRTVTLSAAATLTAGDLVFFEDAVVPGGTPTYNECAGLKRIIKNTGTLFNISAATYTLWKGYEKTSAGSVTMAKIMDVAALLAGRGGLMEGIQVLLSPKGWQTLNNDLAALRRFDGSYSNGKLETGAEAITYFGPTGVVEIFPHIFVKDGDAFMGPIKKRAKRIGATDTTFKTPGRGDEIFRQVEDAAAVELRAYSNDALFLETPAKFAMLSGITYV